MRLGGDFLWVTVTVTGLTAGVWPWWWVGPAASGDWRDRPRFTFASVTVAGTPVAALVLADETASSRARAAGASANLGGGDRLGHLFPQALAPTQRGASPPLIAHKPPHSIRHDRAPTAADECVRERLVVLARTERQQALRWSLPKLSQCSAARRAVSLVGKARRRRTTR